MAHLIDKDAALAKIDSEIKLLEPYLGSCAGQIVAEANSKIAAYNQVKDILNTLEVKEVDLDFTKEVDVWIEDNGDSNGFFNVQDLAKHFFELGMRVNNPITAADRGMAEEIIINLKRV